MEKKILELALETLEMRRAEITLELEALHIILQDSAPDKAAPGARHSARQDSRHKSSLASRPAAAHGRRKPRSAAARRAQSLKMKSYWAQRKAAEKKS